MPLMTLENDASLALAFIRPPMSLLDDAPSLPLSPEYATLALSISRVAMVELWLAMKRRMLFRPMPRFRYFDDAMASSQSWHASSRFAFVYWFVTACLLTVFMR